MVTPAISPEPPAHPLPPPALLAAGVAAGVGALVGVAVAGPAGAIGLGASVLVGGILVVLAAHRFAWFLGAVLVVRPLLDVGRDRAGGLEPAMALSFLLVLAGLLWLARPPTADSWTGHSWPVRAAALLLVAAALSVIPARDRLVAAGDVARLGAAVVMFGVVERFARTRERQRLVVTAVLGAAVVPVLVALAQLAGGGGTRLIDGFSRVRGTFVHPNPLALFLSVVMVTAVAFLPAVAGRVRVALVALLLACLPVLLGTYARGAWVAVFLGFVAVGLVTRRRGLLAALGAVVLVVALAVPSAVQRFADVGTADRASGDPSNSLSWRLRYWDRSLDLLEESPLVGIGIGMVGERMPEGVPPHNDYVRAAVETGMVGLTAYLGLLGSLGWAARRAWRAAADAWDRAVASALAGLAVALPVLAITANVLTQVAVLWYVVAIAGLGVGSASRASSDGSNGDEVDDDLVGAVRPVVTA